MDALDRALARALDVAPSPDFVARVRTRVAAEPPPAFWRLPRMMLAAGVVAVALAAAALPALRVDRKAAPAPVAPAPGPVARVEPPEGRDAVVPLPVAAPPRAARRQRTAEVVVAASEVMGLRQMEALVAGGRVAVSFADDSAGSASPGPVRVNAIVIAPIEIAPLQITANREGVGQ